MNTYSSLSRTWLLIGAPVLAVIVSAPQATFAQLEWRVSVKYVLGDGSPPEHPGESSTSPDDPDCDSLHGSAISCDSEVEVKFDYANQVLDLMGRGYRFTVLQPETVLGLEGHFNGSIDNTTRVDIEDTVMANPNMGYRDDAVNQVYYKYGAVSTVDEVNVDDKSLATRFGVDALFGPGWDATAAVEWLSNPRAEHEVRFLGRVGYRFRTGSGN